MGNVLHDQTPLVSVVMSFHNGGDVLRRAIRSVLWQTYGHWELILLNDGSTDGAEQVAMQFPDPRIRVLGDDVRRGLPVRLNQGVAAARGEYIARMDADDVAFPTRFEKQVEYLEAHPEVDVLATLALLVDEEDRVIGLMPSAEGHRGICKHPWKGFPMPHPTWMGRAAWFRRHPYNESASKAQDQVLLFRAYRESRYATLPTVLLAYRHGSLSLKKSVVGRWHFVNEVIRSGSVSLAIKAMSYHAAALLRDVMGILFSFSGVIRRLRSHMAAGDEVMLWEKLRKDVEST